MLLAIDLQRFLGGLPVRSIDVAVGEELNLFPVSEHELDRGPAERHVSEVGGSREAWILLLLLLAACAVKS